MSRAPICPRCAGPVRAPGLMTSAWQCERHGDVLPLHLAARPTGVLVRQLAERSGVPVWCPLPLMPGWTVTGAGVAADDRAPGRAAVVALSGPCPVGGPADMLVVAEEPGVGLGARLAGLDDPDPGALPDGPPDAKVEAAGHDAPLWRSPSAEDRVAFAGEAAGVWLWAVLWPPTAELVLLEDVVLHDLRHEAHRALDLPVGAPSPRLESLGA